jgi:hypothetical protein
MLLNATALVLTFINNVLCEVPEYQELCANEEHNCSKLGFECC